MNPILEPDVPGYMQRAWWTAWRRRTAAIAAVQSLYLLAALDGWAS